jgi:hypothetical protein
MFTQSNKTQKVAIRATALVLFAYLAIFNVKLVSSSSIIEDQSMQAASFSSAFPTAVASFYWKLSTYVGPGCDGYYARCGLDGDECSSVMNPTCFRWP